MTPTHWKHAALVLACISAAMSGYFGLHQSSDPVLAIAMMIGLALAGILSPFAWPEVLNLVRQKDWTKAVIIGVAGLIFTSMDVVSNFGSIAWQRTTDITEASMQQIRHDDTRSMVADNAATLQVMMQQRDKLLAENAWAGTVTADALRGQLAELEAAADREAARGGCGPKCEAIKARIIDTTERIGIVEQRTDLQSRIEAAQRSVDKLRTAAAKVEKPVSAVSTQNTVFASIVTGSLKPSEDSQHWTNQGLGLVIAIFFSFGSMGAAFLGMDSPHARRKDDTFTPAHPAPSSPSTQPAQPRQTSTAASPGLAGHPARTAIALPPAASEPSTAVRERDVHKTDAEVWRAMNRLFKGMHPA